MALFYHESIPILIKFMQIEIIHALRDNLESLEVKVTVLVGFGSCTGRFSVATKIEFCSFYWIHLASAQFFFCMN